MATGLNGYVEFTGSNYGGTQKLRIYWEETYDLSTWTSNVSITKVMFSTTAWTGTTYDADFIIKVNGVPAITIQESDGWKVSSANSTLKEVLKNGNSLTGSVTGIAHNTDGTKNVNISVHTNKWTYPGFWAFVTWYESGDTYSQALSMKFADGASQSIALTTLQGASTIATGNGTFGAAQTITVTRYNNNYTHTIVASCAGQTQTIATKSSSLSISWTPAVSIMNSITTAMSASCVLTCTTYNGNTVIGTSSITVTLSLPTSGTYNVTPAPSLALSEPSGQTHVSTYGGYVQGKSKLKATITDGLKYSATLQSRTTTANGSTYTAASFTTGALTTSGTNTVSTSVKDSRGRTGSASATVSVLAYSSPAISSFGVHRCTVGGTHDDSGTYFTISYAVAITALGNHNTRNLKYRYRESGGAWTGYTNVTLSNYTQSGDTAPVDISTAIANGATLEVEIVLTDAFESIARTTALSTVPVTMDLNEYGDGVAFGKSSTMRKAVDFGNLNVMGHVLGLGQARAEVPNGGDFNDYREPGVYSIRNSTIAASVVNSPSTTAGTLRVWNSLGNEYNPGNQYYYILQEYLNADGESWVRRGTPQGDGTTVWNAWVGFGTKTALGLGRLLSEQKSISNGSSTAFTMSNNEHGVVLIIGASSTARSAYLVNSNSSGSVGTTAISSSSGITVSTSTNTLTISNSSGYVAYAIKLSYIS